MGITGKESRCSVAVIVVLSMVLGVLLSAVPSASAAEASTVTVLRENFENPNFNCDTGWDQDGKEMWVRGDSNAASGVDTWCHSKARVSSSGNTYSLWCAVIGDNSIATAKGLQPQSNTASQRYDANMSAFIRHSLSMNPQLGEGTLTFTYWSMTMVSSAPGGYDHLSVSVSADNVAYTTIWTQPSASVSSWEQASVTVPSNARTISFDFVSGPYSGADWKEGAYIDNILVTQKSDASWSHVNPLPLYSKGTFDIEVSVDSTLGVPDGIKLYYKSSTSSSFALYTDSSHTDGKYANGEVIHFDSSLTGGALDYQFYSIASGGGTLEPQPSAADASTSVDVTSPQTASSVSRTVMASGWYDGPVKVSLIGSDDRSGVGSIQYKLDGSTWATWGGDLNIDKEGAHDLTYHAVDKAGNVEEDHKISINVDGTAPTTSYSFDGAGKLSLLASDGASGPSSTRYRLDEGEWQVYSSPLDVLNAGHDTLEFYSTDNAGNAEVVRTVDLNNAPMSKVTLTLSGVESSYSEGDTVKLAWSCDDPAGEVDHYEVLVDGDVVMTLDGTASSFDLTGLAEGEHSITVRAVDSGGNSTYQTTTLSIGSTQQGAAPTSLPIIVAIVAAAVAVAAGLLFWRRRSK